MRRNFWSLCLPLQDIPGAGGGAGAGTSGTGGAPYRLSDDALVDLGDGKPVKWSEARASRFVDRSEYDDYVSRWNKGVEFLTNVAKTYDQRGGQRPQPGRVEQQRQQQQGIDYDELAQQPVVDGATIAKLARELKGSNAPLATALAQIATKMQGMEATLEGLRGATGTLAEEHSSKEFDTLFTKTLKSLPEIKGLKGQLPADDPAVRDLFDDVYLSHDQRDPSLRRDISSLVAKRVEGIVALVRRMDKAAAEEAVKARRRFPSFQRGNGQGSGSGGFQYKSGADLARDFFGSADTNT
jgi:hypothetical protein